MGAGKLSSNFLEAIVKHRLPVKHRVVNCNYGIGLCRLYISISSGRQETSNLIQMTVGSLKYIVIE